MGIFPYGEYFQVWQTEEDGTKKPGGFCGQFNDKATCYRYMDGKLP